MTTAEYISDYLIGLGITDVFGVPGGVILKLISAFEDRKPEITPHLNYHEQMSGFAALGYAQTSGNLGVCYATRGPGICNMITCIAEAFQESVPVLFITAHGRKGNTALRAEYNQELELSAAVSSFTKYSAEINSLDEVEEKLAAACTAAANGRRGPVFLDFASSLFSLGEFTSHSEYLTSCTCPADEELKILKDMLGEAERPVILIGDGLRNRFPDGGLNDILEKIGLPVISSRGSQDLASGYKHYYGYIGSHGTRYGNFILSKADLLITVGNRLAFPFESESFSPILKKKFFRVDIDENEFIRKIDGSITCLADAGSFLKAFSETPLPEADFREWLETCQNIREALNEYDITMPVAELADLLRKCADNEYVFVSDVGNNEFWFSRAYEYIRPAGSIVCSKNFGTLGSALGRAIGACYAAHKKVLCIIGDQGFQYNLQELQFIFSNELPIKIIIMDNQCSGMIYDHESKVLGGRYIHVFGENGYSAPDFKKISLAYGVRCPEKESALSSALKDERPLVYRISYSKDVGLIPNIPRGKPCQDMAPFIEPDLFEALNNA